MIGSRRDVRDMSDETVEVLVIEEVFEKRVEHSAAVMVRRMEVNDNV